MGFNLDPLIFNRLARDNIIMLHIHSKVQINMYYLANSCRTKYWFCHWVIREIMECYSYAGSQIFGCLPSYCYLSCLAQHIGVEIKQWIWAQRLLGWFMASCVIPLLLVFSSGVVFWCDVCSWNLLLLIWHWRERSRELQCQCCKPSLSWNIKTNQTDRQQKH